MWRTACIVLFAPLVWAQLQTAQWKTDFSRKSIELDELHVSVPRDQFRPVDRPVFIASSEAVSWLTSNEPVLVVEHAGEARAYPLQILLFHELVNDEIAGVPLVVSFCPLCNTGIVFSRRIGDKVYNFGVAGSLRHANMVMYDRETESFWQQATGEAIVGAMTGARLEVVTSRMVPFGEFRSSFSDGRVLSRQTGMLAPYGESHYVDYEFGKRDLMPVRLERPLELAPLERVLAVSIGGRSKAFAFSFLKRWSVYASKLDKERFIVFYEPEMLSAMDGKRVAESRAVGSAAAYSPMLDGKRLRFQRKDGRIIDKQTKSVWNVLGVCEEGPLKGKRLEPVPHAVVFAFAQAVFDPQTHFVGVERGVDLLQQSPSSGIRQPPAFPQPERQ